MMASRGMSRCVVAMLLATAVSSEAQHEPSMIPTVLARVMSFGLPSIPATPTFFVGRTPTGWPAELTPHGVRVIGGGLLGDTEIFPMRIAVFEFPRGSDPMASMTRLASAAGYSRFSRVEEARGGFLSSAEPARGAEGPYCKDKSSLLAFGLADSLVGRLTVAVHIMGGEAAKQNCAARPEMERMRADGVRAMGPKNLPPLEAPAGTLSFANGSSWSGSNGELSSSLRTTMPVDSIVAHYTSQFVRAGWKTDGAAIADARTGIQRLTVRDGEDAWNAALIVMAVGDRREVSLRLSRVDGP
jgi:hypothetical protein